MADFWQAGNLLLQRERAKAKEKLSSKLRQKPGAIDQTTLLQQVRLGKKTGVASSRRSGNSGF